MSANHVYDVIVIGAGISGLSGAKLLTENGINLLVLEAQDRVGGRTWTVKNSNVGWVDLGGAYIGRGQNRVLRMIKEFGLKLYTVNEKEKLVHYDANKEKRSLFHHDEFPNIDLLALLDVNHILRLLDKMSETIPSGEPWNALKAEEWDQMTFREFVHQNTISKYAREIIANIVQTSNTSEPYETSLLAFLSGIKEAGGVRPLLSTTNGAQEFKVLGGTNQICDRLVECVGTSRVLLKHPVYSLKQHGDFVVVRTLNGKEFRCKFVINATPPAVQQKIHYQPSLPPIRNQLIQRTPMGSVIKCVIYYEKLFWRSKDMCGSLVILGSDDQHPITFTVDDTKPDGSFPAIVGFIPANKARKLVDLSKKERLYLICESLAKAFDCEEARKPIHYEEYNWMENQYCGGGYCMNCPPGFITRYGRYIAQPFGQMYFAGTEVASEWSGYIDGAIQAGERAARQIMALKGLISEDEIDQKESESIDYCLVPFVSSTLERYAPSAKEFLCGTVIVIIMLVLAMARIYG